MRPVEVDEADLSEEEVGPATTLEEFLALPEIEDAPAWEFFDGRMVRKVSPQRKHSVLQYEFVDELNGFAEPRRLGTAFPELRCTFRGRSIVPDVVFHLEQNIELDEEGEYEDEVFLPPDLMIEIVSPGQSTRRLEARIGHALAHGCSLGWLVHTYRRTITVFRRDVEPIVLGLEGMLVGDPVLPGFEIPVAEVFEWLKHRRPGAGR